MAALHSCRNLKGSLGTPPAVGCKYLVLRGVVQHPLDLVRDFLQNQIGGLPPLLWAIRWDKFEEPYEKGAGVEQPFVE
jgi:hypothetical protein